ncbi:methyltransferase domain-containing protein [Roseovarius sp. EL26]|uniref:methyltransferase domain-containing protein n=1 Tax=Roseovarius sp. EL26 TaxID=2126672 RepID=UPI000EA1F5B6|nr:methyltransferase domain-containing protein [Roseovarius sp. EL26]
MKRQAYIAKTQEERAVLREILRCRDIHSQIISERMTRMRERFERTGKQPKTVWLDTALGIFSQRALEAWVRLQDLGVISKPDELGPYPMSASVFERCLTPPKYRIRPYNLLREKLRLATFAPEVFDKPSLKVLDLSPGTCANHEILSARGHSVTLADYWDRNSQTTSFQPFWTHYNVHPLYFDGRVLPIPLPTAEHDLVLCHQAINFYANPPQYLEYIREICRLAKTKVIIIFNASEDQETGQRNQDIPDLSLLNGWNHQITRCPETYLPTVILEKCEYQLT